jgi:hypothetical protein
LLIGGGTLVALGAAAGFEHGRLTGAIACLSAGYQHGHVPPPTSATVTYRT